MHIYRTDPSPTYRLTRYAERCPDVPFEASHAISKGPHYARARDGLPLGLPRKPKKALRGGESPPPEITISNDEIK